MKGYARVVVIIVGIGLLVTGGLALAYDRGVFGESAKIGSIRITDCPSTASPGESFTVKFDARLGAAYSYYNGDWPIKAYLDGEGVGQASCHLVDYEWRSFSLDVTVPSRKPSGPAELKLVGRDRGDGVRVVGPDSTTITVESAGPTYHNLTISVNGQGSTSLPRGRTPTRRARP